MNRFSGLLATSVACTLGIGSAVEADVLVEERFDYTQEYLDGANGGTGFGGAWDTNGQTSTETDLTPLQPSLSYTGYESTGASSPSTGLGSRATRLLAEPISTRPGAGETTTIWAGYLYSHHGTQVRQSFQGLQVYQEGSDPNTGVSIGLAAESISTGRFTIEVGTENVVHTAPDHEAGVDWLLHSTGDDNDRDVPFFLLAKLVFTGEGSDLRADGYLSVYRDGEALPTEEPAEWDAHAWRTQSALWASELSVLSQTTTPHWWDLTGYATDEIRLGTTMADVLLTPIPEPTSLALMGLGSVTLLGRRRR